MPRTSLRLSLIAALASLAAGPAAAVLEEPAADAPSPRAALCVNGTVWDGGIGTCIEPEFGLVPDEELFAALRAHAHAGRYAEAERILAAMKEQGTPRVLTAEGFILRRSGQVPEGLALYAEALALDPRYHMARAYLGMWHLEEGDREGALAQLAEIEAMGARGGEAWRLLSEALEAAPQSASESGGGS